MSDVKKENEKRSTVFIERNSGSGLVSSTAKFVSNRQHAKLHAPAKHSLERHSPSYHGSGGGRLSTNHPMLDRNHHAHSRNNEIMTRTLRERIVHVLAVRPYKKPELIDRMYKDGLREKEKKELWPVVKQVSYMKENTYHLLRHLWNDVSEDWPFYSEEERQAFRRRKPQNLTPPGSDGSTGSSASGHSSSSSHPASPQPSTSLKRPYAFGNGGNVSPSSSSLDVIGGGPASKKKRISNYVRRTPERSPPMHSSMVLSGESKTNAWLKAGNGFGSSSDYVDRMQHSPPCGASTPESEPAGGSSPSRSPYNPPDDFRSKFTTIYTDEQRKAYKAEFAKEYAHYLKLHDKVSKVSSRFAQLENELQKYPDYTSRYQQLSAKIKHEYEAQKRDKNYMRVRDTFQILHEKLAHIKKLVHNYDVMKGNHS